MGAGAVTCFTWVPSARDEGHTACSKDDPEEEVLQSAFAINVVIPKSLAHGMTNLNIEKKTFSMTDRLVLSARPSYSTTASSKQILHQLPVVLLKRLLLRVLERRNELFQQQPVDDTDSEMVLTIPTTRPYTPLHLYIASSMMNEHIRIIFDMSKPVMEVESGLSLSLQLCSRCGVSTGCNCGWRQDHAIWPQLEHLSILEFVASSLPFTATANTASCFNLHLRERRKENISNFSIQNFGHKVQRPMVECPYTVFKIELHLGNLTWRISRRYREFVKLHSRLKVTIRHDKLPQLPSSKWFAVTEHSFLLHRQRLLENYLKGIFMIEEIQDTVPLLAFLGVLSTSYFDHVALRNYRRQILHLQVLEFYTRPGDLILFNSRAKVSGIQRSMTRSEWDHVAIVVPSRDNSNLQLLEATGDGVTLTPLTARLLAYSTFHVRYFVLRKLHTPLLSRAVVNDLLERFASEVEGLPYGLSIRRILHAKQAEQSRSRGSTFFCSELVAEAYQGLGIISSSSEANDFWPGSFSPGDFADAELARHGASLSPEIIIDCKLLEVATATQRSQNPALH